MSSRTGTGGPILRSASGVGAVVLRPARAFVTALLAVLLSAGAGGAVRFVEISPVVSRPAVFSPLLRVIAPATRSALLTISSIASLTRVIWTRNSLPLARLVRGCR